MAPRVQVRQRIACVRVKPRLASQTGRSSGMAIQRELSYFGFYKLGPLQSGFG